MQLLSCKRPERTVLRWQGEDMPDPALSESAPRDVKLPPGPGGAGFGRLRHRMRDGIGFYELMHREYGNIVYFRMLSHKFCVIFDPALFQEVFIANRSSFEMGPIFKQSGMINDPSKGLTADGEEHARTRKLVRTPFANRALNEYGSVMVEQAVQAQAGWRDGDTIDLDSQARKLALDIATNTFFGADMRVEPRIIKDVLKAIEWSMTLVMLPFGRLVGGLPLPGNRHRARAVGELDDALHRAIANARGAGEDRTDLVSLLVHATDEDGIYKPFNDSELRDLCFVLLFTGHETVATAITWCLYHLGRNPEVRERLEKELDEVLGDRSPTPGDYRNLVYTRAVLDENLRVTPPLYIIGRRALEDCDIGGYRIPKDTIVQLCWRIPHLSESYFPDADAFRPERWMEPQRSEVARHAYFPFGGGEHTCVGSGFGKMAVVLTLATLCRHWRFDIVSSGFPALNTAALFRLKNGLPARLSARKTAP